MNFLFARSESEKKSDEDGGDNENKKVFTHADLLKGMRRDRKREDAEFGPNLFGRDEKPDLFFLFGRVASTGEA